MISLNLLPDVKKQYLKAQRTRNAIFTIGIITSAAAIGLVVLGFVTVLGMRLRINSNQNTIASLQEQYASIENISEILTIRNQAEALPALHAQKPVADRTFKALSVSTPTDVALSEVVVDFEEATMVISGQTNNFLNVNIYVDTLENVGFITNEEQDNVQPAFSQIVTSQTVSDEEIGFEIEMAFQPAIFDSANDIDFTVPDLETTQSERKRPIFERPASEQEEGEDG